MANVVLFRMRRVVSSLSFFFLFIFCLALCVLAIRCGKELCFPLPKNCNSLKNRIIFVWVFNCYICLLILFLFTLSNCACSAFYIFEEKKTIMIWFYVAYVICVRNFSRAFSLLLWKVNKNHVVCEMISCGWQNKSQKKIFYFNLTFDAISFHSKHQICCSF